MSRYHAVAQANKNECDMHQNVLLVYLSSRSRIHSGHKAACQTWATLLHSDHACTTHQHRSLSLCNGRPSSRLCTRLLQCKSCVQSVCVCVRVSVNAAQREQQPRLCDSSNAFSSPPQADVARLDCYTKQQASSDRDCYPKQALHKAGSTCGLMRGTTTYIQPSSSARAAALVAAGTADGRGLPCLPCRLCRHRAGRAQRPAQHPRQEGAQRLAPQARGRDNMTSQRCTCCRSGSSWPCKACSHRPGSHRCWLQGPVSSLAQKESRAADVKVDSDPAHASSAIAEEANEC
jgi:hypothetical protein